MQEYQAYVNSQKANAILLYRRSYLHLNILA